MNQSQLIQILEISKPSFRRWRAGLGIAAKDTYSEDEQQQFLDLKERLDSGEKFRDAIAAITGKAPVEENPLGSALIKRAKSQLDSLQPEAIGEYLIHEFDRRVAEAFIKGAKAKKPTAFEEMIRGFDPLALDEGDCLEALLLEEAEDVA
jgi:hypothetical protein